MTNTGRRSGGGAASTTGWMQTFIFFIGNLLFIHSILTLVKAIARDNQNLYKIISPISSLTMYLCPMLLFYCQVVRCSAFILKPTTKKMYFWLVFLTFEIVYGISFIFVITGKLHQVNGKDFQLYEKKYIGYQVITILRGVVDILKVINEGTFFFFLFKFFTTKGVSVRRALLPYTVYLTSEVLILTSTTILFIIQSCNCEEIWLNNYWIAYSSLVLVEMQSFGLDFKKIVAMQKTAVFSSVIEELEYSGGVHGGGRDRCTSSFSRQQHMMGGGASHSEKSSHLHRLNTATTTITTNSQQRQHRQFNNHANFFDMLEQGGGSAAASSDSRAVRTIVPPVSALSQHYYHQ